MTETRVPSSSRKEKARRLTVELYADGQHDERRQEAEPHKQDAWRGEERRKGDRIKCVHPYSSLIDARPPCAGGAALVRVLLQHWCSSL